jgi:hypothetical protein
MEIAVANVCVFGQEIDLEKMGDSVLRRVLCELSIEEARCSDDGPALGGKHKHKRDCICFLGGL